VSTISRPHEGADASVITNPYRQAAGERAGIFGFPLVENFKAF
jgi:hypothetical protein